MVAIAYRFGHLPIRCGELCKDERVRKRFGCDASAKPPAYGIYCWECWGECRDDSGTCSACAGTGQVELDRCPAAYIGADENAILRAYQFYRRGHWPAPGTWRDQAQQFITFLPLLDAAWGAHTSIDEARNS